MTRLAEQHNTLFEVEFAGFVILEFAGFVGVCKGGEGIDVHCM